MTQCQIPTLPVRRGEGGGGGGGYRTINVGSVNYEHAWYIAKMEGIVSVIVTAVDNASLSAL